MEASRLLDELTIACNRVEERHDEYTVALEQDEDPANEEWIDTEHSRYIDRGGWG